MGSSSVPHFLDHDFMRCANRDREQTQVAPSAEPMGNFHIQILTDLY
jgi:hypothetical protein